MALKIRLQRGGAKKRPYYTVVVAEASSPRDGRFVEKIGTYNPLLKDENEQRFQVDVKKASEWLRKGAKPTDVVAKFFKKLNVSAAAN